MKILDLLIGNLSQSPETLLFPQAVKIPEGYRGLVRIEAERCVGCASCAYVCASRAIVVECGLQNYRWCYDPGQCTYCGRCVEYCPVQALQMEGIRPSIYIDRMSLCHTEELAYPRCEQCGEIAQPVNRWVLQRVFAEISPEVESWSRLCLSCRQKIQHTVCRI
jgi:formate hydrogenlyase subunit 6/NADH:ubiquinone oxidoreductase subunit I